jgi:3-deoxy-D-manno-octulosonate 8-phosphate phosphatase (KDO 8-P phosphatase)
MAELGVPWENILFIGNDVQDISLLKRAGVSVAPANSADEAKAVAHHVAEKKGGEGVVREVLQAMLEAKGLWEDAITREKTLG